MNGGGARRVGSARRIVGGSATALVVVLAALGGAGCGGGSDTSDAGTATTSAAEQREHDRLMAKGERVFDQQCASCHGLDGRPHTGTTGEWGPSFDDVAISDPAYIEHRIAYGGYGMQSFEDEISEDGKRAVTLFVLESAGADVPDRAAADDARVAAGKEVFDAQCRACHRLEGEGATIRTGFSEDGRTIIWHGTDFDVVRPSPQRVRSMVLRGDWWMPAMRRRVSGEQIEDVTAYVTKVAGGTRFVDPRAADDEGAAGTGTGG